MSYKNEIKNKIKNEILPRRYFVKEPCGVHNGCKFSTLLKPCSHKEVLERDAKGKLTWRTKDTLTELTRTDNKK